MAGRGGDPHGQRRGGDFRSAFRGRLEARGRGGGRGVARNNVWNRAAGEAAGQSSSSTAAGAAGQGFDRWEVAAGKRPAAEEAPAAPIPNRGSSPPTSQDAAAQGDAAGGQRWRVKGGSSSLAHRLQEPAPGTESGRCYLCNDQGHIADVCPNTPFCEICSQAGHVAAMCGVRLPWECNAQMCAFQSQGQGLFYIPEDISAKQAKNRNCYAIITVLDGIATQKEIEAEFNMIFASSWRCSARRETQNQFSMRFPNAKEVERAAHFKEQRMRCADASIKVEPWSEKVGSKGELQQAWVKVSNIPIDKRSEKTIAFVGSLVGITLEVDRSTIHRQDWVRIRLGCRNVKDLPSSAEGCLGLHFYDFRFEVEQDLSKSMDGGDTIKIAADREPQGHINKKAKGTIMDLNAGKDKGVAPCNSAPPKLSDSMQGSLHATVEATKHGCDQLHDGEEGEEESEEDGELFLDRLARENSAHVSQEGGVTQQSSKYGDTCSVGETILEGPLHVSIEEMPEDSPIEVSSDQENLPPLDNSKNEMGSTRHCPRLQGNLGQTMLQKATNLTKKKNLEGLHKEKEKAEVMTGAGALLTNALTFIR